MVVTRGPGQASDTRRRTVDGAGKIVVSGLTKRFGTVTAVDDLSFTVEPGTITGFLGPNGAGKTTTLRMLLGLVTPDAGSATIGGRPYRDLPRPYDAVGAALEATGFHPARSGRNHLRVYCTVNGYPRRRADEVLDLVGLSGAGRRAVATRWGCASAWRWRQHCSATRGSWCSTNRPTASIRRASPGCGGSCATWPPRARPCWCPATCWPRRNSSSTTW